MLTKLKIASLITLVLVIVIYFSSPWWAVNVAKSYLPNEISGVQAKIDYPRLTHFNIQSLRFELVSAGLQFKISELSADYALREIKIHSISISSSVTGDSSPNSSVQQSDLPNLLSVLFESINRIFEDAGVIESIHQLTIQQLSYSDSLDDSNQLTIENLSLTQANGKLLISSPSMQLSTNNSQSVLLDKLNQPISMSLTLELNKQQLNASLQQQEVTLASIQYAKHSKHETIRFLIRSELLEDLVLKAGITGVAFNKELQFIDLEKTIADNSLQVKLGTEVTLSQQNLNNWFSVDNQAEKQGSIKKVSKITHDIESEIDFKLQLGDTSVCMTQTNCHISLAVRLNSLLELHHGNDLIKAESIELNLDSYFTSKNISSLDSEFDFDKSSAKLNGSRLFWMQADVQDLIEADKNSGSEKFEKTYLELTDFEIGLQALLPQVPLASFFDGHWSLQAEASAKKMTALFQPIDSKSNDNENKSERVNLLVENGLTAAFSIINQETVISSGTLSIPEFDIDASYGSAKANGKITWQNFNQNLTLGNARAEIQLVTPKVSEFTFDTAVIKGSIQASEKALDGSIHFSFNEIPMSAIEFQYRKIDQSTRLEFAKQEVNLEVVNHLLSIVSEQQKIPLQILSGSLTHSGDALLAKSALLSSQLNADKITVLFGENKVIGLKMNQLVTSISPKVFKSSLEIESIDFSSGLQISDIHATIDGRLNDNKENLEIKNISAKILEGQLNSKSLLFIDLQLNPSKVTLSALSLAKLIEFIEIAGLQAEGLIDLSLPISSSNGQLVVKDGKFQSIGKGIIRYSSGGEQNLSEKNIVFQALENFHFESFDGDISYDKDGQYFIKLHLLGANPEFYDGYPIDFTLNLNGQLTGIFRSLFLTGNFEQAVLEQVEAQQQEYENQE